jgi:acyl-CoA thioesterase-1
VRTLIFATLLSASVATGAKAQVVALGASSTKGIVASEEAWTTLLEGSLRSRGLNVSVSNQGVFGDTSDGMRGRLDSVAPQGTRVVILDCCGNDNLNLGHAVANTEANLTEMVKKLRSRSVAVVFLGPTSLGQVASRSGARYCGRINAGVSPAQFIGRRGAMHADAEGNAVVAAHVLPCVVAALRAK